MGKNCIGVKIPELAIILVLVQNTLVFLWDLIPFHGAVKEGKTNEWRENCSLMLTLPMLCTLFFPHSSLPPHCVGSVYLPKSYAVRTIFFTCPHYKSICRMKHSMLASYPSRGFSVARRFFFSPSKEISLRFWQIQLICCWSIREARRSMGRAVTYWLIAANILTTKYWKTTSSPPVMV